MRAVVHGRTDTRVRATWRVLLAVPLLWVLTGGVLAGNVQSAVGAIPSGDATGSGLAQSLLHAASLLLALAVWARYLDRRPLTEYGLAATPGWAVDLLAGFLALVLGFGVWTGLGALSGAVTVTVAPSLPQGSVLLGLVAPAVALVLHAAVQQVVFFRVILETAAEGLHSRGLGPGHAALAGVPVTVGLFVLNHGDVTTLRAVDLVVAGTVFSLLYLHTGRLALGIGAHFGALYGGIVVSALVETSGSLPGVLGVAGQYGSPKVLMAYLLLLGWLALRQRPLDIRETVAARADAAD